MSIGIGNPIYDLANLPGQGSGGGGSTFEYTTIDNSFSMEFDGAGSYMIVNNTGQSLGITQAISFSAWIKLPLNYNGGPNPRIATFMGEDWIFGFRGGTPRGAYLLIYNTDGTANSIHDGTTINDTNWHHVAATYDGTSNTNGLKIYIDGINTTSATATSTGIRTITNNGTLIGAWRASSPVYKLQGNLDELAVWSGSVISESTVKAIYDATANNPGKVADLSETPEGAPIAWYRMGD
jgi:hypothetical protein